MCHHLYCNILEDLTCSSRSGCCCLSPFKAAEMLPETAASTSKPSLTSIASHSALKSAVALLTPSAKNDFLLELATEDATIASRLLELSGPHRPSKASGIEAAWIQSLKSSADTQTSKRNKDQSSLEKDRGKDVSIERVAEPLVDTIQPCHCAILEEGATGSCEAGIIWMGNILTWDKRLTKLDSESKSKEPRHEIEKALTIVRERCKG